MAPNDALHARQNKMAKEILVGKNGWGRVNAWSMMKPRLELTLDGVHFTGAGSKWITNTLLNETLHRLGYASRRTLLLLKRYTFWNLAYLGTNSHSLSVFELS